MKEYLQCCVVDSLEKSMCNCIWGQTENEQVSLNRKVALDGITLSERKCTPLKCTPLWSLTLCC